MNHEQNNPDRDAPDMPDSLTGELKELYDVRVPVPSAVDDAILRRAAEHLAPAGTHGRRLWIGPVAAAAAIALIAGVTALFLAAPHTAPNGSPAQGDVNGDGQIDILDAFVVARGIESMADPPARWDFTGNGKIDSQDVEALAARAVALPRDQG